MKGNKSRGKEGRDPAARGRSPKAAATAPSTHPEKSPRSSYSLTLQRFPALATAFFTLFFLYVWLRIEPAVQFYAAGPVFYSSQSFLNRFVTRPGGWLEYGAAFLAQLDSSNWLGALVFTLLACLLVLGTRRWLRRFSGATSNLLPFVPAFLLLLLREVSEAPFLARGLGVLVALGAALGYTLLLAPADRESRNPKFEIRNPQHSPESMKGVNAGDKEADALPLPDRNQTATTTGLRLGLCSLLSVGIFYVAGLWPCLLWAMLAGLYECGARSADSSSPLCIPHSENRTPLSKRWLAGAGCFLSAGLGPLWLICCHGTDPAKLWLPGKPGLPMVLAAVLFLFLPLASVTWWMLSRQGGAASPRQPALSAKAPYQSGRKWAFAVGLLLLGWAAVWQGWDTQRQALAQIEYYASQKDYEKVLTTAASVKGLKPAAEIRLQLALYHSGRLCQDLFSFTNQANWRLLPSLGGGLDACRAQSQTLLELGQVSEAEHLAHEALEWEGERPETLRLLAQINILKDRPQAARVFLNVLRQVPTQRQWAENYLRQLAANPRLPEDKELALIRTRLVKTDLPHVDIPVETFMRQLLHSNPRNQMALEYLMAHYLVSLEMGKLVERLKDLDAFGYTTLPRHLEEAILLHQQIKHVQVDLCGHPIRPETLQRFQQWSEAIRQGAFMSPQGRAELARDFGDTYWYYFLARQGANNPSNS